MKFSQYPFDEQNCHLSMESREFLLTELRFNCACPVSHTTDDLVFEWYPEEEVPLVVEPISLPQLGRTLLWPTSLHYSLKMLNIQNWRLVKSSGKHSLA